MRDDISEQSPLAPSVAPLLVPSPAQLLVDEPHHILMMHEDLLRVPLDPLPGTRYRSSGHVGHPNTRGLGWASEHLEHAASVVDICRNAALLTGRRKLVKKGMPPAAVAERGDILRALWSPNASESVKLVVFTTRNTTITSVVR
jgi:hypothetical protein